MKRLSNFLQFAQKNGNKKGYPQVIADTFSGVNRYAKFGFREVYQYWYRVSRSG